MSMPTPNLAAWGTKPIQLIDPLILDSQLRYYRGRKDAQELARAQAASERAKRIGDLAKTGFDGVLADIDVPDYLVNSAQNTTGQGLDFIRNSVRETENGMIDEIELQSRIAKTKLAVRDLEMIGDATKNLYDRLQKGELDDTLSDPAKRFIEQIAVKGNAAFYFDPESNSAKFVFQDPNSGESKKLNASQYTTYLNQMLNVSEEIDLEKQYHEVLKTAGLETLTDNGYVKTSNKSFDSISKEIASALKLEAGSYNNPTQWIKKAFMQANGLRAPQSQEELNNFIENDLVNKSLRSRYGEKTSKEVDPLMGAKLANLNANTENARERTKASKSGRTNQVDPSDVTWGVSNLVYKNYDGSKTNESSATMAFPKAFQFNAGTEEYLASQAQVSESGDVFINASLPDGEKRQIMLKESEATKLANFMGYTGDTGLYDFKQDALEKINSKSIKDKY